MVLKLVELSFLICTQDFRNPTATEITLQSSEPFKGSEL
jgi:hypothetical protein